MPIQRVDLYNKIEIMGTLYNEDCLLALKRMPDNSIDEMVTDPPYALTSIVKRFGNETKLPNSTASQASGFMGKKWDASTPSVEIWKECLRVMKPGAFAFICMTPRQDSLAETIYRLGEAGFNTGFTSIYWTYASGFPKAHNIGKSVDKMKGAKREVVGYGLSQPQKSGHMGGLQGDYQAGQERYSPPLTPIPATPEAKSLDGSYGGFQPKPAVEIIIVAMKPMTESTFTAQALSNGKGITWLDDARIPYANDNELWHRNSGITICNEGWENKGMFTNKTDVSSNTQGRFPANLLVSDDVLNDGQNHIGFTGQNRTATKLYTGNSFHNSKTAYKEGYYSGYDKNGSYSRYFDLDAWFNTTYPFLICPKASKSEKNKGCENAPTMKNGHPTVKPLKLMSYLIVLGSREGDVVLDPFAGSGTTLLAAKMLNRQYIGCEMDAEYCKIIEARLSTAKEEKKQEPIENQFIEFQIK